MRWDKTALGQHEESPHQWVTFQQNVTEFLEDLGSNPVSITFFGQIISYWPALVFLLVELKEWYPENSIGVCCNVLHLGLLGRTMTDLTKECLVLSGIRAETGTLDKGAGCGHGSRRDLCWTEDPLDSFFDRSVASGWLLTLCAQATQWSGSRTEVFRGAWNFSGYPSHPTSLARLLVQRRVYGLLLAWTNRRFES
jgi:hypothetical protein